MTEGGKTRTRKDRQGQRGTDKDKEGCKDLVMTEGTDQDNEGQTDKDKEGCNDLVMTEGADQDNEEHTGTRRVIMTW